MLRGPQEESEEYAAYHQGTGHGEAHAEEGLLYQPLEEGASQARAARETSNLALLCRNELESHAEPSQHGACARYVGFIEEAGKWVGKAVKTVVHVAKKVAKSVGEFFHDVKCDATEGAQAFGEIGCENSTMCSAIKHEQGGLHRRRFYHCPS